MSVSCNVTALRYAVTLQVCTHLYRYNVAVVKLDKAGYYGV